MGFSLAPRNAATATWRQNRQRHPPPMKPVLCVKGLIAWPLRRILSPLVERKLKAGCERPKYSHPVNAATAALEG
jgi:hypothetical protein